MVVKLTKSQLMFNEIKKEVDKIKKIDLVYYLICESIIGENNIVGFKLCTGPMSDFHTDSFYCFIKNKKIVIPNGILKGRYELIRKLIEKSKFEWEVLIL
jgi:hypothetical protein